MASQIITIGTFHPVSGPPIFYATTIPPGPTPDSSMLSSLYSIGSNEVSNASAAQITSIPSVSASTASAAFATPSSTSSPPSASSSQGVDSTTPTSSLSSTTPVGIIPTPINNPSTASSAPKSSSGSSVPQSSGSSTPSSSSAHGLSNGTVAGIVIGVGVGLALLTFLATFLCMRRRKGSVAKSNRGVLDTAGMGQHYQDSEPKGPSVIETPSDLTSFENFLPQSADDKTVQNNVKTALDQIELHVENFYQNASASGARSADAELTTFNSPYLPSSLAALLPQTNNRVLLIKHALAHFITSCISATASPDWSLLPEDFVLLPSAIRAANSSKSTKPGFGQSMSRWRVLTAYLRPNPLDDTSYIAQRDHQINEMVQVFSRAFAPWQNPKYKDKERVESLSAILKEAAGLGIWMFSQPSELQFQWPKHSEVGSNKVAVTPALVKLTDERGQSLSQPQVMIKIAAQKV